jgi:hypothetical protein
MRVTLQRDGSFHQHSDEGKRGMMLSGSYGNEFSSDLLNLVAISNGTQFAIPTDTLDIFVTLLLDGQQWATTPAGWWDWEVIGRDNSMPGRNGPGLNPEFLAALPSPRSAELENFALQLKGIRFHSPHFSKILGAFGRVTAFARGFY